MFIHAIQDVEDFSRVLIQVIDAFFIGDYHAMGQSVQNLVLDFL